MIGLVEGNPALFPPELSGTRLLLELKALPGDWAITLDGPGAIAPAYSRAVGVWMVRVGAKPCGLKPCGLNFWGWPKFCRELKFCGVLKSGYPR